MSTPADERRPGSTKHDEVPGAGASDTGEEQLGELRSLLVGSERRKIAELEQRLEDRELLAEQVSEVLPDAIARRPKPDERLGAALGPTVDELVPDVMRRKPDVMADAIFPILGPAIRKAIAHAINGLMETINRTMEQTLSASAVRWRLQAWRSGRPFSEIVLANSFVYRTEQVLLVHKESGLLLQDVAAPGMQSREPELVSAMLTAIQDFVRDSFETGQGDELDQLRLGELNLLIEQGPGAVVCAAVRGVPPAELRTRLQRAIETIHAEKSAEIDEFEGDAARFEVVRPLLETCLSEQKRPKKKSLAAPLLLGTAAVALAVGLGSWWLARSERVQRWERYVGLLSDEPGILVVESGERDGRFYLRGLRDPMAADPAVALQKSGLEPGEVDERWQGYQASVEPFVLARATRLLEPPPSASLRLSEGRLHVTGRASPAWVEEARRRAALVTGITEVVTDGLQVVDAGALAAHATAAAGVRIRFVPGAELVAEPQAVLVAALDAHLSELDRTAEAAGVAVAVTVIGSGDPDDDERQGVERGRRRAAQVREALLVRSWRVTTFGVRGRAPRAGAAEAEAGVVVVDTVVERGERR